HVIFARSGSLLAVPFDLKSKTTSGTPVAVIEGVRRGPTGAIGTAHYAISRNGVLVYGPGPVNNVSSGLDLAFTDSLGRTEMLDLPAAPYGYPRISRNGKRVTVATSENEQQIVAAHHHN